MKRDDDLIREILMFAESAETEYFDIETFDSDRPSGFRLYEKEIAHCNLLADAGLLVSKQHRRYRMTNQGHDYLAAIRDDTVWNKTKAATAKAGGATLGITLEIATAFLKQKLGLS